MKRRIRTMLSSTFYLNKTLRTENHIDYITVLQITTKKIKQKSEIPQTKIQIIKTHQIDLIPY